jgi:hypothetical protein
MNQIIALNDSAILYLQLGNSFETCDLLTKASKIVLGTKILTDEVENRSSRQKPTISERRGRNNHGKNAFIRGWVNLSNDHYFDSLGNDTTSYWLHPSLYQFVPALCINSCQEENSFSTPKEIVNCNHCNKDDPLVAQFLSPVVRYNLGLSCHILGRELGGAGTSDGRFYFNISHFLYQKAIEEISLFEGVCEADAVDLYTLIMAALNNQACIHHEMSRKNDCYIALDGKPTEQHASVQFPPS